MVPSFSLMYERENDMSKNTRDTQILSKKASKKSPLPKHLEHINLYAAGIDE
jgi:hypothetical protein